MCCILIKRSERREHSSTISPTYIQFRKKTLNFSVSFLYRSRMHYILSLLIASLSNDQHWPLVLPVSIFSIISTNERNINRKTCKRRTKIIFISTSEILLYLRRVSFSSNFFSLRLQ